jgi:catechol 2,3-dioxygenase
MHVQGLGHVVLKVRNRERSEQFYSGLLGIPISARLSDGLQMTFFTLGNHHDFAVMEVGDEAPSPDAQATGLAHVAFKVGDSLDELRSAKAQLAAAGVSIRYEVDHTVTKSLYLQDPDGNEVELYVDASDVWKSDPQTVASAQLAEF